MRSVYSRRKLSGSIVQEIRIKCELNKKNIGVFALKHHMSWASIQKIVLRKTYVNVI